MSKHKNLKRNLLICLLAGSAVMYTLPLHAATSVIDNNTLPTGGKVMAGNITLPNWVNTPDHGKLVMDITQSTTNGVIKWDSFDVGGSATVNFKGPQVEGGYNTLNYVNAGGSMSQIYGTINANNNGNIFIVNPAGVQIGNSAQINVGSLHVSNKNLDNINWEEINNKNPNINDIMSQGTTGNAALMSLGNINATKVIFEGNGRIVIDSERIKDKDGNAVNNNFEVHTNDDGNVIIGYEAYNTGDYKGTYEEKDKTFNNIYLNDYTTASSVKGYMWVEDVEQLQAINTNLGGNYALRNSIDATGTEQSGFNPIGLNNYGKVIINNEGKYGFSGKFDGIDYNIFGLNINQPDETNVGLFGVAHDANINNVTLVGGSITGGSVVGSVVGAALGNTHITNATNSASVTGNTDVGGIVGYSGDELDNVGDSGSDITGIDTNSHFTNLVNTGIVHSKGESDGNGGIVSNAGGLIGYMYNGKLDGNSYNLGDVSGDGYNVGGLVGHAVNSTIGDGTNLVYNRLDVTGKYNVGGIVGNMEGTTVQNAENSGNVTATGYTTGEYTYHTGETNLYNIPNAKLNDDGTATTSVNIANVGGIAGKADDTVKTDGTIDKKSEIKNVTNSGNVSSSKQAGNDYYDAGNVGGIVGSAVDTNITNATNRENEVRGAHNVGGVAGYFGNSNDNNSIKYTINRGINDGGDIMATGARKGSSFVTEIIRPVNKNQTEKFIIGNIGGIAGYMDGNNVYITGSGNRGTVHTDEPANPANVEEWQKAANVGGIVGKIDRSDTKKLDTYNNIVDANGNLAQAAVSDSYNTGDVLGYTGIGGIAGLMYNGEIASSYNLGYLRSTRQSYVGAAEGNTEVVDALNMGGIVGDTTEESNATALLYDVYNKGQIGDKEFNYFGRHVGGVVGRLSGTVEKSYNTGAIYNGYNVVGGIAGWVATGTIQNAFNTGNITVYNKNENTSQLGGIVGAANGGGGVKINNVYNLGTLRSFNVGCGSNAVAGILGAASGSGTVTITNAYTTGNLYSGKVDNSGNFIKDLSEETVIENGFYNTTTKVNSIYAATEWGGSVTNSNTYYIKPDTKLEFTDLAKEGIDNSNKDIDFSNKSDYDYVFDGGITRPDKTTGVVDENSAWRIYGGNTPILNAFLPKAEEYFDQYDNEDKLNGAGIGSIQYGTAYDPLLTIINAAKGTNELKYNWEDLGINNAAGIAVYGAGLTLDSFRATGATGYFGGTIYADGALNINGVNNDIGIGSAADIYGSAVNITTDGKVTIYGDVTATGNTYNGTTEGIDSSLTVENAGDINIAGSDVDVYGKLTSASDTKGATVTIPGIEGSAVTWKPGTIDDPYESMADIADRFAHTTGESKVDGNITINAGTKLVVDENGKPVLDENGKEQYTNIGDGNVNLYYGNKGEGLITTGGDLTVTGTGDVYVDSDLDIAGNMTLTSTGSKGEVLLTLTNIGKVQADRFMDVVESVLNGKDINYITNNKVDLAEELKVAVRDKYPDLKFDNEQASEIINALITSINNNKTKVEAIGELNNAVAVEYMHDFMESFNNNTENYIALNANSGDAKLTVDMWDGDKFNFKKYDSTIMGQYTFVNELEALEFYINEEDVGNNDKIAEASKHVYVEVDNGEQLKGIQSAGNDALGYNYALMGDINASDVKDYEAIGGENGEFTGTFDGRGNRVIGLDTTKSSTGNGNTLTNAGIFSTIGEGGTVKNVNIYSGNFEGTNTAGSVAGMNSGRIENVTGFGNTVTVTGASGNAGGIVGVNNGKSDFAASDSGASTLTGNGIYDVQNVGSVIAGGNKVVAGGLVGLNAGALGNSYSDSAVTVKPGVTLDKDTTALGGVVGVNTENGDVRYVDSLGITNGGTNSSNVGGIIGVNKGNMYSGYNESIVSGKNNVGGIIGDNSSTVANVVNATSVTGKDKDKDNVSEYVGGLIGSNNGDVNNGRNNGTITGTKYVGGMVGNNAAGSTLTNLVNDSSAAITGTQYVGGIAGNNAGEIKANNSNLINRGSITGHTYVGGVAGTNSGTITNANNNVELNADTTGAQYFGGIAGENTGTIENATNTANVNAAGANYVGGIVGLNKCTLNGSSNKGSVTGLNFVGGVAGKNVAAIKGTLTNGELTTIKNGGIVTAEKGGAGGIFGVNEGVIDSIHLVSEGIVKGTNPKTGESGTGGIFGINKGKITNSVLENTKGTVSGVSNTGGLIGINSGDISQTSLKNVADINIDNEDKVLNIGGLIGKNTGKIEGGRDAADSYYKYQIYNNGTINVTGEGKNVGGLIGYNADETASGAEGSLTAGYNTGTINASGSTNVGGIVGNNAGTVDQVFNTVMTENGTGAISGGNNVGGLVGTNSGTLSNAYNTTEVTSTNSGVVGNAVGENSGTITNIYASNIIGNLIGTGYDNGKVTNAYSFATGDSTATKVLTDESVQKAEESYGFDNKNDGTTWKFYDGYSNPLLKVFLTTLTVDSDQVDLVYNAGEQDLNIGELVGNVITAPIVKDGEEIIYNGLDAYYNTVINGSDLGESELLQNTMGQKDAGTYDNWLYSGQIASGSKDGSGFNPNNLGYDIVYTKNDSGETGVEIGKATINIDLGKVEHTYGNADVINGTGNFKNEAGYGFNITNSNLTQEMKDELNDKGLGFVFEKDNALTGDTSGRVTEDVKDGGYTWSANFELSEELKKNYQFDDNGSATLNKADGQSIVNQAKLEISVDDAETMPGVVPNFTGTNIQQGLVNGDVAGNYDYALDSSVDINVDDIYTDKIGISFGNSETYYDLDNVDWSTIPGWEFLKNYDINFDPGTLTVDSEIMPDLPDNWPNNRWDYLFGDNPFDRNENFRERKAEVNFVDGAMEI